MKKKLNKNMSSLVLMLLVSALGLTQTYDWGKRIGGAGTDSGRSTTIDASGNVYIIGVFQSGVIDCDPGPGVYNLTFSGTGYYNNYVTKLDASGNFLWAKSISGTGGLTANDIKADASGNIYIYGDFDGTVDFDPSATTFNLSTIGTHTEAFVQKLNSSGDFIWAKKINGSGGAFDFVISADLEIDASGNLYLTGSLNGTADFNPGAGVFNLTANWVDIYICKLDASGIFLWAKIIGGSGDDEPASIALDASGNIYTTGFYQNTVDFDPGAGTVNLTSAGFNDAFVLKLNSSGSFIWAKSFGGSDTDEGTALKVDASGNVYTTGTFKSTADFDPGIGTFNMTSVAYEDIYVCKLDASGNFIWAKVFSGADNSTSRCIDLDGAGNVYVGGQFASTYDFDPSAASYNLVSSGGYDAFISKLDPSGNFVWARSFGALGTDLVWKIKVDVLQKVHAVGSFEGTVDLDPTIAIQNTTSNGSYDAFILKWGQCSPVTASISISSNQGNSICSGTTAVFTATPVNGGSSPTYQWQKNGMNVGTGLSTYTTSSLANNDIITCVITSNNPCANPAIASSNSITMTVGSSIAPSITILSNQGNSICTGTTVLFSANSANGGSAPSYQWQKNGTNVGTGLQTYTSNTFADGDVITCILTSNNSCSNITTVLSNSITMSVSTPIVNIIQNGQLLIATAGFNSYQWSLNGTPINGATNVDYNTNNMNGNYSVSIVDVNGCVTSTGYNFNYSGIEKLSSQNIKLFPNPSGGNVTILFDLTNKRTVQIIDLTGKIVFSTSSENEELKMNLEHLISGIYSVIITNENGMKNRERFVITK